MLTLIFTLFFLMFALRRFHLMAGRNANRVQALVALADKARPVAAEPEPWKGPAGVSVPEPIIDHEEPAAGLLRTQTEMSKARVLLKLFRIEARFV